MGGLERPGMYQPSSLGKKQKKVALRNTCTFFSLAWCSPAAEVFFSHFRLRGKQGGRRYITSHAWIPARLRGGVLNIQGR